MRWFRILLTAAVLGTGLGFGPAWADNNDAGGSWCAQNPDKCANLKARRDEYCKKNPPACETSDTRRDSRGKGSCKDNPEKCGSRRNND